jgi:hypothetical protein
VGAAAGSAPKGLIWQQSWLELPGVSDHSRRLHQ